MRTIKKKTWPKWFQAMADGDKLTDLRLADFPLQVGDTIIFREYDPDKKKYTGRELIKKVARLNHVHLDQFHPILEMKNFGHWIIETK